VDDILGRAVILAPHVGRPAHARPAAALTEKPRAIQAMRSFALLEAEN
jgi:hypothetical protein